MCGMAMRGRVATFLRKKTMHDPTQAALMFFMDLPRLGYLTLSKCMASQKLASDNVQPSFGACQRSCTEKYAPVGLHCMWHYYYYYYY